VTNVQFRTNSVGLRMTWFIARVSGACHRFAQQTNTHVQNWEQGTEKCHCSLPQREQDVVTGQGWMLDVGC